MDFAAWLAFAAASSLLLLLPGPNVLLVLSYALTQGRRVALATVAGVAIGDTIAMTASLAGLGSLVLASAELFTVLKGVGAAYMVYLGVQLLRSAGRAPPHTPQSANMVVTFVGLAAINALAHPLLAEKLHKRLQRLSIIQWVTRVGGCALIAMYLATAAASRF